MKEAEQAAQMKKEEAKSLAAKETYLAKQAEQAAQMKKDKFRFFLGRLGETSADFEERFGKPIMKDNKLICYSKFGVSVGVSFDNGKADSISYMKELKDLGGGFAANSGFSEAAWKMLFEGNKSGGEWNEVNETSKLQLSLEDMEGWVSEDNTRIATYLTTKRFLKFQTVK